MRSFLQCFPLQSLVCSLQSPSLFYSNEGLSCHSLPGADTYIVAKCISLLSDNPRLQMCPVCLCSYKLAPIELFVFLHMKVGRVNKSVCCPRKVRWIDCFCGYMKGLRLALWLVIKMVILMEATGYSGPTLPQYWIKPRYLRLSHLKLTWHARAPERVDITGFYPECVLVKWEVPAGPSMMYVSLSLETATYQHHSKRLGTYWSVIT